MQAGCVGGYGIQNSNAAPESWAQRCCYSPSASANPKAGALGRGAGRGGDC